MKLQNVFIGVLCLACFTTVQAQSDKEQVQAAILDYVEGIYEVQPERIKRSVHPQLMKKGFWRPQDQSAYKDETVMTFDQLVELAGKWNAKGWLPEDAPKEIEIYDVLDKTAVAKLTAYWGVDYFHLAKYDDKWMITNVLWQSLPAQEKVAQND
ncbi:hypothetical protein C900_00535 [Fulvivirga imtechensis AK7]|uniref:Nuclear transport factor 2 family protein n=1 Tax=Fulvivirga imtechensis AK7 TaxID=1237149 RepID=L8JJA7_9BACT|nr:nuclear transport factor 2 family protein [Fulvivirga imtechensis]ELR68308.1 hypothetical protein C900_00535 [Fulvivirga imtechensis AK7]